MSNNADVSLSLINETGDVLAFSTLLRRSDQRMRSLAYRLVGDRVAMDDVLQTAYLKAYRSQNTFRGDAAFETWLYSIVYRTCVDYIRSRTRRPTSPLTDDVVQPRSDPVSSAADRLTIADALKELPLDQRAAVWLVDGEGHTFAQAAEILDERPGTVASRVSRGRSTLRTLLGTPHEEEASK